MRERQIFSSCVLWWFKIHRLKVRTVASSFWCCLTILHRPIVCIWLSQPKITCYKDDRLKNSAQQFAWLIHINELCVKFEDLIHLNVIKTYEVIICWNLLDVVAQQIDKRVYLLQIPPVYLVLPQHSQTPIKACLHSPLLYN